MAAKLNVMNLRVFSRYDNEVSREGVICQVCEVPLPVGIEYVSRIKRPSGCHTALYCKPCAEELCII